MLSDKKSNRSQNHAPNHNEDKASKWLVNFQGPNFDIPEELKENVGLIGAMCEVSRLQSIDTSDHLTFPKQKVCVYVLP